MQTPALTICSNNTILKASVACRRKSVRVVLGVLRLLAGKQGHMRRRVTRRA